MVPGTSLRKSSASSNSTGTKHKTAAVPVHTTTTIPNSQIVASTPSTRESVTPPIDHASVTGEPSANRSGKRGPTKGKRIRNIMKVMRGKHIPVYVTPEMRAFCGINANKASSEIGTQIRRMCPKVGFYHSWKRVDSVLKEAIFQAVRDKICVTENGVENTELVKEVFHEKANELYKDWKWRMGNYYVKTKDEGKDPYQHPYQKLKPDEWTYMIDNVFNDPKRQARKDAEKKNRGAVLYNHTLGSRSFPAAMTIAADDLNGDSDGDGDGDNGARKIPDFCDLYRVSHILRDTEEWIDPTCKLIHERMEAMRDEAIQFGTPLSNEELSRICLGEATTKNYIRGFGKGPKPSTYFSKSKSLLAHQDQLQKVQYELNLIREKRQREREEEKTRREEEQKQREEEQRRREEEWEEEKRRWERQRDEEREEEKRRWDEEQRRRDEEQRQERAAFLKEFDAIKNYFQRSEAQW